ncbi:Hypothetical predicted protein [Olea europaea subsp. europaea]|uniref:Uncharacterized protein n=1 Tax=Olea europaea subsp. europaea TaxID=158383 RepID=A0A8S0VDC5_OLEEU|nr:Hypothetical predicted protein [Olea europaea subsp. europaea]
MAKLTAEILRRRGEYLEIWKKSHEELVNLEAKKKEKEQLNKEIQESMDRVKELDKEIKSLETKSKLKEDAAFSEMKNKLRKEHWSVLVNF